MKSTYGDSIQVTQKYLLQVGYISGTNIYHIGFYFQAQRGILYFYPDALMSHLVGL